MKDLIIQKYGDYLNKKLLILTGELNSAEAKNYIQDANVVIVPSLFDNFPYTVLETMAAGKIVLASKQGGQCEVIVDEQNGFLFDHTIQGNFIYKLKKILTLHETVIKQIGKTAAETIAFRYSPEIIYKQKIAAIETFLKNKQIPTDFPFINAINRIVQPILSKSENKKLSIVIPYYNMGNYIEECVKSVIKSDYPYKEIIIIDDGSTDNISKQKLIEIEKKYLVTVFRKLNEGLPKTRNYGASIATGEYLAFLDADDSVKTSYYTKAIHVLNNYNNVFFVGCWTEYTGMGKGVWPTFNPELPYLLLHNMVNSSALVYKRDAFLIAGLNKPEMVYGMEDWESVICMVEQGYHGVVLPELLFNYRVRKGSMSRSFTRVKQLHLKRLISQAHPSLYNNYGSEIFNLLNANGSSLFFDNPTFEPPSQKNTGITILNSRFKERLKNKIKQNKHLRAIAYKIYRRIKK